MIEKYKVILNNSKIIIIVKSIQSTIMPSQNNYNKITSDIKVKIGFRNLHSLKMAGL